MSAWGGPPSTGAWANQIEEEEEENGGELDPVPAPSATAFPALGGETAFPALGDAINVKDSKKDRKNKKVKNTMSLGAFVAAGRKEPEIVNLPTGPRQRAADEEEKRGGLGGGFKNYGGDRGELAKQSPSIREVSPHTVTNASKLLSNPETHRGDTVLSAHFAYTDCLTI